MADMSGMDSSMVSFEVGGRTTKPKSSTVAGQRPNKSKTVSQKGLKDEPAEFGRSLLE